MHHSFHFVFIRFIVLSLVIVGNRFLFCLRILLLCRKTLQARNVFTKDIELNIHQTAFVHVTEVCVFLGIRNDGHSECVSCGVTYRKRDAVYRNRTFVDGEVTTLCEFSIRFIFKGVVGATIGIAHCNAGGGFINVSLYNMPI